MSPNKARILFVSHKANRSGAPVLLFEIISDFSRRTNIPFSIISMEDGELVRDFKKLGKTYVWKKQATRGSLPVATVVGLYHRVIQVVRGLFIIYKIRKSTLIFYNTIVNGHMQKKLSALSCKSICYVHELEAAIHMLTNEVGRKFVLGRTDLFLAVSEAVKKNLVAAHGVDSSIVKVVASPLNETARSKLSYTTYIEQFNKHHRTGAATIIGVVANNEWRKGFDLFIPLIMLYFQRFPDANTFFAWKGFKDDSYTSFFDLYDYNRCQHKARILLLPHGNDSIEQMACFDIHLLLSREDPYPLVVLEAATLGIPTVCFAGAGGAPEFVEDDCGFVVPYADLDTMASRLQCLVHDTALRKGMGNSCQKKVMKRHRKEKSLQQITDLILQQTGNGTL